MAVNVIGIFLCSFPSQFMPGKEVLIVLCFKGMTFEDGRTTIFKFFLSLGLEGKLTDDDYNGQPLS